MYEWLRDFFPPKPAFLPKDYPDLTGKVALVTGSNTGIGYETAKALLLKNATVVFANRNYEKTQKAIETLQNQLGSFVKDKIVLITTDLSDLTSIKAGVEDLKSKGITQLHYTILNAGVMQPVNGSKTKQGYELQIGTNVLGHHLLQKLLTPLVLNAVEPGFNPRVVWLSSAAHLASPPKGIDWDSFRNASNSETLTSYGQSKTGNIYQAYIYGQQNKDVISLAVHPGYLQSELQRSYSKFGQFVMSKLFLFPTVYGSYTELFATLSPQVTLEDSGRYIGPFGNFRELRDDIHEALTDGTAQKFWDWADAEVAQYV